MPSTPNPAPTSSPAQAAGIDPRGPRVTAGIVSVFLLAVVFTGVAGLTTASLVLLALVALTFGFTAIAGVRRHPLGWVFRLFIRPRLAPPTELEPPQAPRFAQAVGFVITAIGALAGFAGASIAVPIAAAAAFIAAGVNAAFGYCIGCQMYVLILRLRRRPASL